MQDVVIKIQSIEDAKRGPLYPEHNNRAIEQGALRSVAILEGGMTSGKTSLGFMIDIGGDRLVWCEVSPGIFDGIASAFKGARERFGR